MFRFPYQRLQPGRVQAMSPNPSGLLLRLFRLLTGQRAAPSQTSQFVSDSVARPFVSVRIQGPVVGRRLKYALLDTGSQDTLFPIELAESLGIVLGGEKRTIKWRGQQYWVEFHVVELELVQSSVVWRWRTRVGFTAAPLSYALLGHRGCLEFLDATFRGADQVAELETNRTFPGMVRSGV
jgi:hypothetical protein